MGDLMKAGSLFPSMGDLKDAQKARKRPKNRRQSDAHSDAKVTRTVTQNMRHSDAHSDAKVTRNVRSSRAERLACVASLATFYPGRFPLETGQAYAAELESYNKETIMTAVRRMARECEHPSLSALVSRCDEEAMRRSTIDRKALPPPKRTFDPSKARAARQVWRDIATGRISPDEAAEALAEYAAQE